MAFQNTPRSSTSGHTFGSTWVQAPTPVGEFGKTGVFFGQQSTAMSYQGFGGPQSMGVPSVFPTVTAAQCQKFGDKQPTPNGALPWAVRAAPNACMPVAIFHLGDGRVVSMPLQDLFDGVPGSKEFIEQGGRPAPGF